MCYIKHDLYMELKIIRYFLLKDIIALKEQKKILFIII